MKTTLTDDDPMPFGKYKGQKMLDVPASYLFWLWTNGKSQCPKGTDSVADYILANMASLKLDHPDGIWD